MQCIGPVIGPLFITCVWPTGRAWTLSDNIQSHGRKSDETDEKWVDEDRTEEQGIKDEDGIEDEDDEGDVVDDLVPTQR
jgi:hypothetical protein